MFTSILITAGLGFLGGWLSKALHLRTKTSAQVDKILGAAPGTGQAVLDLAGQSLLTAAQNAAQKNKLTP